MLAIPEAALSQHMVFLGKTGAGKTFAVKGVVEHLLEQGARVCVIDPTGAWHGLRSSASGKRAGFPVVIFGGAHADLPLAAAHGEAIAEIVGTASTPAIIDVSLMRVGERTRFFADFADALVRKNKGPLHLVIDEAHLFAPQGKVSDPQSGAMLHAANNLVSLGRSRGLRIILITQRPAKLHKDSLTQIETMVALRLIAPQDRRAVEDWIKDNADEKQGREIIASLASLKTGQGWVWAPELGILERVTFPRIKTFDTSKAPDEADADDGPVLAPIDRDAIQKRLETVAADALANDPARLKAEIAKLRREAAAVPKQTAPDPQAIRDAVDRGFERGFDAGASAAMDTIVRHAKTIAATSIRPITPNDRPQPVARPDPQPNQIMRPKRQPATNGHDTVRKLGAERKPLAVLASVHPAGMTEAQWAVASGLKRTGGTWSTYLSRLRTAGYFEERDRQFFITDDGLAACGAAEIEPMPEPGPKLVAFWASRINAVGPMLNALAAHYPNMMTREDLAEQVCLAPTGGTFNTYLSRLRAPGLIEEDSDKNVRAAKSLMEGI